MSSAAKIIVGTLILLGGLAIVAFSIRITRQPNGDAYGIVLGGGERLALGLLLALAGVIFLATSRRS